MISIIYSQTNEIDKIYAISRPEYQVLEVSDRKREVDQFWVGDHLVQNKKQNNADFKLMSMSTHSANHLQTLYLSISRSSLTCLTLGEAEVDR